MIDKNRTHSREIGLNYLVLNKYKILKDFTSFCMQINMQIRLGSSINDAMLEKGREGGYKNC